VKPRGEEVFRTHSGCLKAKARTKKEVDPNAGKKCHGPRYFRATKEDKRRKCITGGSRKNIGEIEGSDMCNREQRSHSNNFCREIHT